MTRSGPKTDGERLCRLGKVWLRPFVADDIGERYLSWLNDSEVNAYSQRLGIITDARAARDYLARLAENEAVLAIEHDDFGHVGNVKYGPLDLRNRRSDISILIGEMSVWGKGVGRTAIFLAERFLFEEYDLHRVDAGTANPRFSKLVEGLGWVLEGQLRDRVRLNNQYVDWFLFSQLRGEFEKFAAENESLLEEKASRPR